MPVCACPSVRARCAHASVCVLRVCMLVCACPVHACLSVQPGVCVPVFVCSVCAFWCVRTPCVRACVPVSAAWCVRTPCVHASVCVPIYAAWCVRTRLRVPWCVPVCACHEAGAGSQRAAASSPGFEMCALFSGLRKGPVAALRTGTVCVWFGTECTLTDASVPSPSLRPRSCVACSHLYTCSEGSKTHCLVLFLFQSKMTQITR